MASSSNGNAGAKKECWCGMEAKLFTSHTQENPGRPFWRCVRQSAESGKDNHLFQWIEEALMEDLVKAKYEIDELKNSIEELKKETKGGLIGKVGLCAMVMIIGYLFVSEK